MVRSMTGYGRGEQNFDGFRVTVELKSVNNRYLDCNVKLPRSYIFAEDAIRSLVQSKVSRGKVDILVTIANESDTAVVVKVNEPLARGYLQAMKTLSDLEPEVVALRVSSIDLGRFPDVLTVEKQEDDLDVVRERLLTVTELAVADFTAMREREGAKLKEDVLQRAATVEQLVQKVEERSPQTVAEYRNKLYARLQEVLQSTQIDQNRILTEAAIYADKVAVDEETVRLHSHIAQLRELLGGDGAVGRKLDFLLQEFNREANTIGSKCTDLDITRMVLDIKAELEKIREQIQNLE